MEQLDGMRVLQPDKDKKLHVSCAAVQRRGLSGGEWNNRDAKPVLSKRYLVGGHLRDVHRQLRERDRDLYAGSHLSERLLRAARAIVNGEL